MNIMCPPITDLSRSLSVGIDIDREQIAEILEILAFLKH